MAPGRGGGLGDAEWHPTGAAASVEFRDGPLENLWGRGGDGRSTKKIFAQGKIK